MFFPSIGTARREVINWNETVTLTPEEIVESNEKALNVIQGLFKNAVKAENWEALAEQTAAGRKIAGGLSIEKGKSDELDEKIERIRKDFSDAAIAAESIACQAITNDANPELFEYSDAGNGGRNVNDCFTRAIATVMNRPYQEVWDELDSRMQDDDMSPDNCVDSMTVSVYLDEYGFKRVEKAGEDVQDQVVHGNAIVLAMFLNYPHVVAIRNGKVVDTWNSGKCKVLSVLCLS